VLTFTVIVSECLSVMSSSGSALAPGDLAWIPATSTQARFTIPPHLMYGNNRAAWLPVVIKKLEANDQIIGTLEWDRKVDIKCKANLAHPRDSEECSVDLSKLKYHNEGAIIHSLGMFYAEMKFSAKIAKYFISINPGHRLVNEVGHHHNAAVDMMSHFTGDAAAPLNIYTAADAAYRKVSEGLLNLTVVLRGNSGSGKTEVSKHILQYLLFADTPSKSTKSVNHATYTSLGHAHNPFVDVVVCTPVSKAVTAGSAVLDIFGSAPSGRNPTSSRIIRQTKLTYDLGNFVLYYLMSFSLFVIEIDFCL
jgi:myosin heavy subunit